MKNTDREGGAPQGGNVVMHVSQIKSVANIRIKSRMQTYSNNTVKHEQRVYAKSHKKFKARRKSCWTIRKTSIF